MKENQMNNNANWDIANRGGMNELTISNAKIIYRNFSGKPSDYNREGARNFSVVIPDADTAIALFNAGWNVAVKPESQEDKLAIKGCQNFMERLAVLTERGVERDPSTLYHLKCTVNLNSRKPADVYLVAGLRRKPIKLDENTIGQLDYANIANCDLQIHPYHWSNSRGEGIAAYLSVMYVTIVQDPFAEKYGLNDDDEDMAYNRY